MAIDRDNCFGIQRCFAIVLRRSRNFLLPWRTGDLKVGTHCERDRGFTQCERRASSRNGCDEREILSRETAELSWREKARWGCGTEMRSERGTEWVKGLGKKREKYTSVANESRDDWFAYSRYARTVSFHLLSRSRLPLFPVLVTSLPLSAACLYLPSRRSVHSPFTNCQNAYGNNIQ